MQGPSNPMGYLGTGLKHHIAQGGMPPCLMQPGAPHLSSFRPLVCMREMGWDSGFMPGSLGRPEGIKGALQVCKTQSHWCPVQFHPGTTQLGILRSAFSLINRLTKLWPLHVTILWHVSHCFHVCIN